MAMTSTQKQRIVERYSTRDQKILSPNIFIKDFPFKFSFILSSFLLIPQEIKKTGEKPPA